MGTWKINLLPEPCTPYFPGQTLTRAFSGMLVSGPFHWIITLPRSSRKMSPLLKLFQESSTCQSQGGRAGHRVSYRQHPGGRIWQPISTYVSVVHVCARSCGQLRIYVTRTVVCTHASV